MLIKVLIGIGTYLLFGIFGYPMFWLSGKIAEQEERNCLEASGGEGDGPV